MSAIAESALINFLMADFANTGADGKAYVNGGGVAIVGFDQNSGLTSRFSLFVDVLIPGKLAPAEFPVELALLNGMGNIVSTPSPVGPQAVRIAQVVNVDRLNGPYSSLIKDHVGTRAQIVIDFGNGLPLTPGEIYSWRVEVDGDDSAQRTYPFAVIGTPPGPVIG